MQGHSKQEAYPEHAEVVVALFERIIDRIHEARIVFADLSDVVGACAGGCRDIGAHNLRDELLGLLAIILERLVRIRVGLEDQTNVGLQSRELSSVVAVPVVGERGHHVSQPLGQLIATFVTLGELRLRRSRGMADRKIVRGRWAAISSHGHGRGCCKLRGKCGVCGQLGKRERSGAVAEDWQKVNGRRQRNLV